MTTVEYDVYALLYGRRLSTKAQEFLRWDVYREPDGPQEMAYYFWMIRHGDQIVLVDCGFDKERGAAKGRFQESDPLNLLAEMGVSPGSVTHIIASHLHYDHIGNLAHFPNASVTVSRAEYDFWAGPLGDRALLQSMVLPAELQLVLDIEKQGRLNLVGNSAELFPGLTVRLLPGHTPGLLITEVSTRSGRIVLASDAIHYYEEMERDRPFRLYEGLADTFRSYEELRHLAQEPRTRVIAGHDPRDTARFKMVRQNCLDLTAPVH